VHADSKITNHQRSAALGDALKANLRAAVCSRTMPALMLDHPGVVPSRRAWLFGSNPGRLVKAVFEAKGSSAGVRG
jgi:hypothetical protein